MAKKKSQSLKKAPEKAPADLQPMLATSGKLPSGNDQWLYEVKWDGYRALSYLDNGNVEIRSRNNKSFNEKFYPVTEALEALRIRAVLDGEIIVAGDDGNPDFEALQLWRSEADGDLVYYVFDLLWHNGNDLTELPLTDRRKKLEKILKTTSQIRLSEVFETNGEEFFKNAEELGLEGIIAKKAGSKYLPGKRSRDWVKIKTEKHMEVIITGYTRNAGSARPFSALVAGIMNKGKLEHLTTIGTGFSSAIQSELMAEMKPLITKKSPYSIVPDLKKPSRFRPDPPDIKVVWLKPELVAEISYKTVSSDGAFRHPSFRGLLPDKDPEEVTLDKTSAKSTVKKKTEKSTRRTFLNPKEESQVRKVNGHTLKFTNLSKLYWPAEKITKRDMLNFYYRMAPYILPYIKERPQTLYRFPNGIKGKNFYQKDVMGKAPEWIKTFPYYSEADEREKEFLVADSEASLLYMANLGCIEINPWSSTVKNPDNPDWCIIDLDPDKKANTFEQVIKAAQVTHDVLKSMKLVSCPKTSGSTGIHIYIPLDGKKNYEYSRELGREIVTKVHSEIPEFTSIERLTKNRKGMIYLDFLQNRPQATVTAPYSLRPKPGAPVSMPLHWDEVKKGLKITDFNINNAVDRVRETGDLFRILL